MLFMYLKLWELRHVCKYIRLFKYSHHEFKTICNIKRVYYITQINLNKEHTKHSIILFNVLMHQNESINLYISTHY